VRRWRGIAIRLGGRFFRALREREWKAEFESRLEMHIEDNLARTREFGLRAALGAERKRIIALVLLRCARPVLGRAR
jgi:hypothetical protein